MAVEGNYVVVNFGDDDVIQHVYNKKMYYSMDVVDRLVNSERTDSEKMRSLKALIAEFDVFEKKLMDLFDEAEQYNSTDHH
jgi:hypothetical protein